MTHKVAGRPQDRRESPRLAARVEVRFQERVAAARAFRAYSLNFSSGGICLKTDKTYQVGAELQLDIAIGGEEHQLTGVVAWVRDGAVGVRFSSNADEDKAKIAQIMASIRVQ